MRFIEVTALEQEILMEDYKNHPPHAVRSRFHALYLSSKGEKVKAIASLLEVRTRTIYKWMDDWESSGVLGILTKPGQGRPPFCP